MDENLTLEKLPNSTLHDIRLDYKALIFNLDFIKIVQTHIRY